MSDPRRLSDDPDDPLASAVLRSMRHDAAPSDTHRRTLAALGLSAGAVGLAASLSSAKSALAATAKATVVTTRLGLAAWVTVGAVGGGMLVGTATHLEAGGAPAASQSARATSGPRPPFRATSAARKGLPAEPPASDDPLPLAPPDAEAALPDAEVASPDAEVAPADVGAASANVATAPAGVEPAPAVVAPPGIAAAPLLTGVPAAPSPASLAPSPIAPRGPAPNEPKVAPLALTPSRPPRLAKPEAPSDVAPRSPLSAASSLTSPTSPALVAQPSSPSSAPSPARALVAEVASLDAARRSLRAGDAPGALRALATYETSFPGGNLRAEAKALRVEALVASGDRAAAAAAGRSFLLSYPDSPLSERVRAAAGLREPK